MTSLIASFGAPARQVQAHLYDAPAIAVATALLHFPHGVDPVSVVVESDLGDGQPWTVNLIFDRDDRAVAIDATFEAPEPATALFSGSLDDQANATLVHLGSPATLVVYGKR